MNRIYRVIWSQVRGAYVVVSEIAKSHTRGSKSFVSNSAKASVKVGLAAMVLTCGSGLISGVQAESDRGVALTPANADPANPKEHTAGGVTWLTPKPGAPTINMFDYNTPGNPGQGYLYTNNKVFGIQIGNKASARADDGSVSGISIGDYSNSRGLGVALGHYAQSNDIGSLAIGAATKADGFNSLAMMRQAYAGKQYAAAIGTAASAKGEASLAMGHSALAEGKQSIAIGSANPEPLKDNKGTKYTKYDKTTNTQATADRAIAIGQGAKSNTVDSIAMGTGANVAVGTNYKGENFTHGIAIGSNALSQGIQGVAIGNSAAHYRDNGVALGNNAKTRAMDGIAIGNNAESGIQNDPQYKVNNSVAVGNSARAHGGSGVALGNDTYALGGSSVAAGNAAWALGERSTAIGNNAHSEGYGSIAMGREASALSTQDGDKKNVVAIGDDAQATGSRSIALGVSAQAGTLERVRDRSVYKDNPELITKLKAQKEVTDAVAIGSEASVQANEGLALGSNATVNNVRGVALGAKSETAAPVSTASETINGLKYNYAGGTADSTVSVGNNSTKRTITNVAAGRVNAQSTDAINGSQLYGVANAVGNVAKSTTNILGGNAQVDQNGTITMTNIGDTGKNTVHEAIKSANSGWELQVDGRKVKDVKAPNRTVNFKAGNNIKLEGAGDNVTVATVEDASFNSVTTGNVSMSTRGINAGGNQITNVQSGGDTLTNAANIGDISRIAAKYDKYLQRGAATYEANGNGKINMTGTNGLTAEVTGLKNTYVTSGTVSNDGKRLTLTRNDNQTFDVDISKISNGLSKTDYRLIANPAAGSNGEYKVAADGSMTLTVADADGSNPKQVKLTNLASKEQQDINTTNITNNTNKIAKGLSFQGDNNVKINKQLGDTLGITGGATGALSDNNIGVVSENGKLNVKLAKDLTGLNSVTTGQTTINNNGLTIGGNTFVTNNGFNANNTQIKNVKAGTEDSDAVNLKQLNEVKAASDTKVKGSKNIHVEEEINDLTKAKTYTVNLKDTVTLGSGNTSVHFDGTTGIIRAGEGANAVNINGTNGTINSGKVTINGGSGTVNDLTNRTWDPNKITNGQAATEDQLKVVDKKITDNGSNLTKKGLNFKGDDATRIHKDLGETLDVVGGTSDKAKLSDNNIGVVSENGKLNVKLAKELTGLTSVTTGATTINNEGLTIGGNKFVTANGFDANNTQIKNVKAGTDGNDAVNLNQLNEVKNASNTTVEGSENINVDSTVDPNTHAKTYKVALKDNVTLGSGDKAININGTTGIVKAGDGANAVTINGTNGTINSGKVTVNGTAGTVNNLTNITWDGKNFTSGQAATEDQLKQALANQTATGLKFDANVGGVQTSKLGSTVIVKGEGKATDTDYSGENIKTFIKQDAVTGNTTIDVKMSKNLKAESVTVAKDGKNGVSITGPDTANGTDGKVAVTDKNGKDAVSMSGKDGVGHIGLTGKDGRNADMIADKGDSDLGGNAITRIKYQDEQGKTHQVATKDDGMKYGGDSGKVINKKLNEQVNVIGGITDASKLTTEDNVGVVSDGTNLKVRMAKDLKGLTSVTTKDAAGNSTVVNGSGITITPASGNTVSLTKDGLNNGGKTISNVGPGVNGTDAVNVNQLKGVTEGMANAINSVAGETQRVGAHAAAMSALKPIQYDPLEPTQVMAGIGNYRGETAAALGIAHYTSEDTMFHAGVSVGSRHNMVNAGVTRKFGTSDEKKAIPERYKGGPISSMYVIQDEMTALKAENARMKAHDEKLTAYYAALKEDNRRLQKDNEETKRQLALIMSRLGM